MIVSCCLSSPPPGNGGQPGACGHRGGGLVSPREKHCNSPQKLKGGCQEETQVQYIDMCVAINPLFFSNIYQKIFLTLPLLS